MRLFNKVSSVRKQSQVTLGPAEAFAAITLIAVASDGYLADAEAQAVSVALSRMNIFNSYPGDVMKKMIDRLWGLMERQGVDALFNAALVALPHDLQETALAITTDISLTDGEATDEEENILNKLYLALEMSEEIAVKIIDLIKKRG